MMPVMPGFRAYAQAASNAASTGSASAAPAIWPIGEVVKRPEIVGRLFSIALSHIEGIYESRVYLAPPTATLSEHCRRGVGIMQCRVKPHKGSLPAALYRSKYYGRSPLHSARLRAQVAPAVPKARPASPADGQGSSRMSVPLPPLSKVKQTGSS